MAMFAVGFLVLLGGWKLYEIAFEVTAYILENRTRKRGGKRWRRY